ncbi:hypothetical protein ACWDRB_53140 [Nonomuraea sp. NPDC003707]
MALQVDGSAGGVNARLQPRERAQAEVRFGTRLAAVLAAERPARDPYGDDPDDFWRSQPETDRTK